MKKIDLDALPEESGSNYPIPFDRPCLGQFSKRLGRAAGLTALGVNITRIKPGVWSSQRHWHSHADEFVMVLDGELILVTDTGEERLGKGDCAAFKAGDPDGHHLINRSDHDALVLEVGTNDPVADRCFYADIDMVAEPGDGPYTYRDGTLYPLNEG